MAVNRLFAALASAILVSLPGLAQPTDTNLPTTVHPAAEANQFIGTTNTLRGRVAQVTLRPTLTFLNLDQPYPDMSVSGVIFASRTNRFGDLEQLKGRMVLITGKITEYNGRPQIVIENTNQLEVLDAPDAPAVSEITGANEADSRASALPSSATAPVEPIRPTAQADAPARTREAGWGLALWLIAGSLAAIAALLAWLVVIFRRSGLGAPQSPGSPATLALTPGTGPGLLSDRALAALTTGALTEPEAQALREQVASELTEYAKQRLVQGLYSQRQELAETQQQGQQQLAEMEARLAALHLAIQERISAYEQRVAELERDLETRDDEMKELVRATLSLVRERLELAKEKGAGRFTVPD